MNPLLLSSSLLVSLSAPLVFEIYKSSEKLSVNVSKPGNSVPKKTFLPLVAKRDLEEKKDKLLSFRRNECVVKIKNESDGKFKNLLSYEKVDDLIEIQNSLVRKDFYEKCYISSLIDKGFLGFSKSGGK